MKIRAIELCNLRRFAGRRARIAGIGDGVTILSEPNEFGKSTFFDALHALFFERHRSTKAPVKSLQPHSGGAPEVAVEIELPSGVFRLEKRWLSKPTARVLSAKGQLIAQDDEAEAWIDALLGQGLAGPSGLLWVRQGLLGIEPDGGSTAEKHERERGLSARRDLLSSVAGEIELMTGGRRMDQVVARATEALGRLATATLKPKAGGEWARAVDEAATLAARRLDLEAKAARLTGDLRRRAELQRDIKAVSDPEAEARNAAALLAAQQSFQAAEAHAEKIAQAAAALRMAQLTAAQGATAIERLQELTRQLATSQADLMAAEQALAQAQGAFLEAQNADATLKSALNAASTLSHDFARRLDLARRARLAKAAQEKLAGLQARLARAEGLRNEIETLRAQAALLRVTPPLMAQIDTACAARDRLQAQIEAQLVSVSFIYSGDARAQMNGQAVEAAPLRLRAKAVFDLPGLGSLSIDPAATTADEAQRALAAANAAVAAALAAVGMTDPAAARQALAEAARLGTAALNAQSLLAEVAPEGIETLRLACVAAQSEASEEIGGDNEDIATLEAQGAAARTTETEAQVAWQEAHARLMTRSAARAAAQATAEAAARRFATVGQEAGDPVALAAKLLHLRAQQVALAEQEAKALAGRTQLEQAAPDLETAAANLHRMQTIQSQRQSDLLRLKSDLAGVNGSIGALADEGIEEMLDEVRGREEAALARAARYSSEVQALARLRSALEAARHAAREAYFGPVLQELEPLLSIIHPGAALRIDDESLLPVALTRDGVSEDLDILSGGTQEQIAILTRLAFARLFAKGGQAVPVILDDALVHSDDDRIEAMFIALHRVARDQQIIVLTCRQRAFASLGGERVRAEISSA